MGTFFERLQKFGRLYENNAPGYLRTHPLTTERIADMDNRIQMRPYRQVADSLEFLLVRAKLRAQQGTARDAMVDFEAQVNEHKSPSEAASRYGLAQAYLRDKRFAAAEVQLAELRRLKVASPMIDLLAAEGGLGNVRSPLVDAPIPEQGRNEADLEFPTLIGFPFAVPDRKVAIADSVLPASL